MARVYSYPVLGITCGACSSAIVGAFTLHDEKQSVPVKHVYVKPIENQQWIVVTVEDDTADEALIKKHIFETVSAIGFTCIDRNAAALGRPENSAETSPALIHLIKGVLGVLAGATLMGLCISGFMLPALASYLIAFFGTLFTLYLGKENYSEAAASLFKRKTFTMDSLFTLSTLIAVVVSVASLFFSWLPMMFDAALLILGFNHVGKALKEEVTRRIHRNLRFSSQAGREALLERPEGEPQPTWIKALLPGDVIIVKSGETLPVDGELLDQDSSIYNNLISGRNYPQEVKQGSSLLAGFKVPEQVTQLRIKVKGSHCSLFIAEVAPLDPEALSRITNKFQTNAYVLVKDSIYYCDKYQKTCRRLALNDSSKIAELKSELAPSAVLAAHERSRCLIQKLSYEQLLHCHSLSGHRPEPESYLSLLDSRLNEPGEEAPLERTANTIMKYFIPTVITIALVSAVFIGIFLSALTALQAVIAILVSACPCTIGMFTALAFKIGLATAATAHFKDAKALQAAQEVDIVLLDLNGTLTKGMPQVTETNLSPAALRYLGALEGHSKHPFAKAIRDHLAKQSDRALAKLSSDFTEVDLTHHSGLSGNLEGKRYMAGNRSMMLAQGFSEEALNRAEIADHDAEQVIYFAEDENLLGCILLSDPLRPDAITMVNKLKAMGKEVGLCTGTDELTALKYAKRLGIERVAADCLGESADPQAKTKTAYIQELSRAGHKVGMIGDGLNDTLAIKTSHFGIAVESDNSDLITRQEAGAVIKKSNGDLSLSPIITAFAVAEKTVSKIKQNLIFSLSYNMLTVLTLGGLLIGLGFVLSPAIGALLMVVQAALILANTYLFSVDDTACANDPLIQDSSPASQLSSAKVKRDLEFSLAPTKQLTEEKPLELEQFPLLKTQAQIVHGSSDQNDLEARPFRSFRI